jgi:hypothetical protein
MAAGSKGIAGTSSLPAQQAGADTLQAYCLDLDQWPRSWSYEAGDIPAGQQMVQCFRPFLHHLLSLHLSRKTLRQYRDNIWVLGGEVISRLQLDRGLRRRPIDQVLFDLVSDDGGPLLSHGQLKAEQRSFDATCRRLFRFLTVSENSDDRAPIPPVATNRPRH